MNIWHPITYCATFYFLFRHVSSFSENGPNATRLSTSFLNSFFGTSQFNSLGVMDKTTDSRDRIPLASKDEVPQKDLTSEQFLPHYPTLNEEHFEIPKMPFSETLSIIDALKYLGHGQKNTDRRKPSNNQSSLDNLAFDVDIHRRKTSVESEYREFGGKFTKNLQDVHHNPELYDVDKYLAKNYNLTYSANLQVPLSNMNTYNLKMTNKKVLVFQTICQMIY